MRKLVVVATLLAVGALTLEAQKNKETTPETLLRWSFAGTRQLAEAKNAKMLREVLALPETQQFREAAAQTIADRAAARFNRGGNTNAQAELARMIQPLVPDLLQNESRFQMKTTGGQDADWMLALKLEGARAEEWSRSLTQLTKAAGMQAVGGEGKNWSATRDNYRVSFSHSKDWVVLEGGFGTADAKSKKEFRSDLGKRRGKQWLDAEINAPLLAKIWSATNLAHAPKVRIAAEPKGDGVRSELTIEYPEDLGIKPEKWNVPTSIVREPLIGFTALQGIEKKLESVKTVRSLAPKETPNQLFAWSQASPPPFSVSLAADVGDPADLVNKVAEALAKVKLPGGALLRSTNRAAVTWDAPVIVKPFVRQAPAPHSSFALAGLFPVESALETNTIPRELLKQLNKKNLVFYEWEITGARMDQWAPLWQLYYLMLGSQTPNSEAASAKWIDALSSRLGNTVTEGTLEGKRQIKLIRQSQIGFNALEVVLLAHWLDARDLGVMRTGTGTGQQRRAPRRNTPAIPPNAVPVAPAIPQPRP